MMQDSSYKKFNPEELENIFSQFLISSWSYSKCTQFARNEKAFEMIYIYRESMRRSASSVAGNAYHFALEHYFKARQKGEVLDMVDLEVLMFDYIDSVPANTWKIQKTTPTVFDCIEKARDIAVKSVRNFLEEVEVYADDIEEVIDVEVKCSEFLVINGVEIPLPCHCVIDLVVKTKRGTIAIIDHKSKTSFTSEEEITLSIGTQGITYVACYESKTGLEINEVWFIENKHSQNRDKSPQLNAFKITIDKDTRRLYEALLYEPLKKMLEAVNNPDYTYVINLNDNFVDMAELYDFWCRTMIDDVEDFDIDETKRELITRRHKKIKDSSLGSINPKVIRNFKQNASAFIQYDLTNKNMTQEQKIEHVLRSFGVVVQVAHKFDGYSSNTYLLEVTAGAQVSSVQKYKLDLANALNVSNVRVSKELVVYENRSYLAIDFSKKRDKDLFFDITELQGNKIPLGKDNQGRTLVWDWDNPSTPHSLVCGQTGSGKSVCAISTLHYAKEIAEEVVIFDPKYEFLPFSDNKTSIYNDHLEIEEKMQELVEEMNALVKAGKTKRKFILFDEFADAVANSRKGKELDIYEDVQVGFYRLSSEAMMNGVNPQPKFKREKVGELKSLEENLRILLQKGRSVGFRIMALTQRASVKVITGDAKVNFPLLICFKVPKEADSRVVIDEAGAESLAGGGDFLCKSPEYPELIRGQAYYIPKN